MKKFMFIIFTSALHRQCGVWRVRPGRRCSVVLLFCFPPAAGSAPACIYMELNLFPEWSSLQTDVLTKN